MKTKHKGVTLVSKNNPDFDWIEWWSCTSKKTFDSVMDAITFSEYIEDKHNTLPQDPYHCIHCHKYHLTSSLDYGNSC